jgi:hypothetical protein
MFFRGCRRLSLKPKPKPRIWNAQKMLDYISKSDRPSKACEAGAEALMLLLLATGIRIDCASKLGRPVIPDLVNEPDLPKTIYFPFLEWRKCLVKGVPSDGIEISPLVEEKRLCPLQAINHYYTFVKERERSEFLFVETAHFRRPNIATLRRWVTNLLRQAEIFDTPGSCRAAATNYAHILGHSVDFIMRKAGWQSESTFVRSYKRNVIRDVVLFTAPVSHAVP